jgi:large subunit ribosomal protein L16
MKISQKRNNEQKGRLGKYATQSKIDFGLFGLKALESGYITSAQIESAKTTILKKMKRCGKIWIKIHAKKPITKKPLEVRMGKGKGSFAHYVAHVKGGTILFEICGISYNTAKTILEIGGSKLPIKTSICR